MPRPDRGKTPIGFKTQLLQRLRNEARRTGIPVQRHQQRIAFERLLARLPRDGHLSSRHSTSTCPAVMPLLIVQICSSGRISSFLPALPLSSFSSIPLPSTLRRSCTPTRSLAIRRTRASGIWWTSSCLPRQSELRQIACPDVLRPPSPLAIRMPYQSGYPSRRPRGRIRSPASHAKP